MSVEPEEKLFMVEEEVTDDLKMAGGALIVESADEGIVEDLLAGFEQLAHFLPGIRGGESRHGSLPMGI